MRRFAAVVLALIMTGCACAGVGCRNIVELLLAHDLVQGMHYDIELCIGGHCRETELMVKEREGWVTAAGNRIYIDIERDAIGLGLSNDDYAGSHDVSLTVVDEDGQSVADYQGTHEMVSSGGWPCGDTCWDLTLDVPDVAAP